MNILLATHNFYPDYWGGTEIYVLHLAKHLISKSFNVKIIAAIDGKYLNKYSSLFEDENINVCNYLYDELSVYGIYYKHLTTQQIYSKYSRVHFNSWTKFIKRERGFRQFDILHVNGFTATIGLDLIFSLKAVLPELKIVTSYHTPMFDPKETLTYGNQLVERPPKVNSFADILSYKADLPYIIAKSIGFLLPSVYASFLPSIFNLKFYIKQCNNAINILISLTDEWWVYSEGIRKHLVGYDIPSVKIKLQRHGIADEFIGNPNIKSGNLKFLYSGRLSKTKGIITLLKAWLKLPQTKDRVLWITAKPISDDSLIQKWINKSINRQDIIWLGEIDQNKLSEYYSQAHYTIIPSEWFEIGPMVFHEAIAGGCNIITTDIGGCKELAEYYGNATIFKAGDEQSLAKIIQNNYVKSLPPLHRPTKFKIHFEQLLETSIYKSLIFNSKNG